MAALLMLAEGAAFTHFSGLYPVPPALQHRIYYKVGDRNSKSEIDRVALRIELAVRGVDGLAEDAAMPITDSSTVAKRVKRELLVRLQGHFENLRPLFFHRSVDVQRWRAAHQELYDRAMEPDVNDALEDDYPKFMAALRAEARNIGIEEGHQSEYSARIVDKSGKYLPGAEVAKREYGALFQQMLAETLLAYTPWVSAFGDPDMAVEYERSATQWHALALNVLSHL